MTDYIYSERKIKLYLINLWAQWSREISHLSNHFVITLATGVCISLFVIFFSFGFSFLLYSIFLGLIPLSMWLLSRLARSRGQGEEAPTTLPKPEPKFRVTTTGSNSSNGFISPEIRDYSLKSQSRKSQLNDSCGAIGGDYKVLSPQQKDFHNTAASGERIYKNGSGYSNTLSLQDWSAVTSPGFPTRIARTMEQDSPLREVNTSVGRSYSLSPFQMSPNRNLGVGQIPYGSKWKSAYGSPSSPVRFSSPQSSNRSLNMGFYKREEDIGRLFLKIAPPVDKSSDSSTPTVEANENSLLPLPHSTGLGGTRSPSLTNKLSLMWPSTTNSQYENPPDATSPATVQEGFVTRKRNRNSDLNLDKPPVPAKSLPNYSPPDSKNNKRLKFLHPPDDSTTPNLPLASVPLTNYHNTTDMSTESILEQMNQTEKRYLPDDDNPKQNVKRQKGTSGTSKNQHNSGYRKRKVSPHTLSALTEEEVASKREKATQLCNCIDCYNEAAGTPLVSKKSAPSVTPNSNKSPIVPVQLTNGIPKTPQSLKKRVTFGNSSTQAHSSDDVPGRPNMSESSGKSTEKPAIMVEEKDLMTKTKETLEVVAQAVVDKEHYMADKKRKESRLRKILEMSENTAKEFAAESTMTLSSTSAPLQFGSVTSKTSGVGAVLKPDTVSTATSAFPSTTIASTPIPFQFGNGTNNAATTASLQKPDTVSTESSSFLSPTTPVTSTSTLGFSLAESKPPSTTSNNTQPIQSFGSPPLQKSLFGTGTPAATAISSTTTTPVTLGLSNSLVEPKTSILTSKSIQQNQGFGTLPVQQPGFVLSTQTTPSVLPLSNQFGATGKDQQQIPGFVTTQPSAFTSSETATVNNANASSRTANTVSTGASAFPVTTTSVTLGSPITPLSTTNNMKPNIDFGTPQPTLGMSSQTAPAASSSLFQFGSVVKAKQQDSALGTPQSPIFSIGGAATGSNLNSASGSTKSAPSGFPSTTTSGTLGFPILPPSTTSNNLPNQGFGSSAPQPAFGLSVPTAPVASPSTFQFSAVGNAQQQIPGFGTSQSPMFSLGGTGTGLSSNSVRQTPNPDSALTVASAFPSTATTVSLGFSMPDSKPLSTTSNTQTNQGFGLPSVQQPIFGLGMTAAPTTSGSPFQFGVIGSTQQQNTGFGISQPSLFTSGNSSTDIRRTQTPDSVSTITSPFPSTTTSASIGFSMPTTNPSSVASPFSFGQSGNNMNAFGNSAPVTTTTSSTLPIFQSSTPGNVPNSMGILGNSNQKNTMPSTFSFGGTNNNSTTQIQGFGSPQTSNNIFGSAPTATASPLPSSPFAFGTNNPQPNLAFGSPSLQQPAFGMGLSTAPQASPSTFQFGAIGNAPQQTPVFGSPQPPMFTMGGTTTSTSSSTARRTQIRGRRYR